MNKAFFLRLRSRYYILLLGLLGGFGFAFLFGCSSSRSNNNETNAADSLKKVEALNDSIKKEKQKKDSIAIVKKKQDSIARVDSINKVNQGNNPYKPVPPMAMYGARPNKPKN
jgi:hypothetical protein